MLSARCSRTELGKCSGCLRFCVILAITGLMCILQERSAVYLLLKHLYMSTILRAWTSVDKKLFLRAQKGIYHPFSPHPRSRAR